MILVVIDMIEFLIQHPFLSCLAIFSVVSLIGSIIVSRERMDADVFMNVFIVLVILWVIAGFGYFFQVGR